MCPLPRTQDNDESVVEIPCIEHGFALVFGMRADGVAEFQFRDYQNDTISYRLLSYGSLRKLRKWLEANEAGLDVIEGVETE